MSEYNNNAVNGSACSYATLGAYNNGSRGTSPPVPRGTVSGFYVVPNYTAAGYGTLQYGGGGCGSYTNIDSAYRNNGNGCSTQFLKKSCM